jgi:hypothetical protein
MDVKKTNYWQKPMKFKKAQGKEHRAQGKEQSAMSRGQRAQGREP